MTTTKSRSRTNLTSKKRRVAPSRKSNPAKNSNSEKKQKTLEELLEDNLKDIYSAEQQLIDALPKMAKAAYSTELQKAFLKHLEVTKKQFSRLEKVFTKFEIDAKEVEECAAMKGLIEEGQKIIEEYEESPVRDSALIIGAQKVEHYEIASYGSICELADVLGFSNLHDLMGRSLDEEETTDEELTEIAVSVNDEAKSMSETYSEEEEDTL